LQILPIEYDNFRSIWDNKPEGEKKVDELITRLRNEEDRMNARKKGGEEEATALFAKTRIHDKDKSSHKKACYHCKRTNHLAKDCRFKNQDDSSNKKKVNKEDVQCHNCKGFGHFAKECSSKRRDNNQQNGEQNRALVGIEETAFLMVTDEKWIVDSGATKHMTPNGDWFSEYRKLESPIIIHVGKEGETVKGIGRGRIDVKLHLGNGKYIGAYRKEVIYVPEMKVNLFSTNEAANKGIGFDTLDGKFREKGKVIAQATHINQMWYMDMQVVKPEKACVTKIQKPWQRWHERCNHQDEKTKFEEKQKSSEKRELRNRSAQKNPNFYQAGFLAKIEEPKSYRKVMESVNAENRKKVIKQELKTHEESEVSLGLQIIQNKEEILISKEASGNETRKSTPGYVGFIGKGNPIVRKSQKQAIVTKSTTEAEYKADYLIKPLLQEKFNKMKQRNRLKKNSNATQGVSDAISNSPQGVSDAISNSTQGVSDAISNSIQGMSDAFRR